MKQPDGAVAARSSLPAKSTDGPGVLFFAYLCPPRPPSRAADSSSECIRICCRVDRNVCLFESTTLLPLARLCAERSGVSVGYRRTTPPLRSPTRAVSLPAGGNLHSFGCRIFAERAQSFVSYSIRVGYFTCKHHLTAVKVCLK